MLRCRQRERVFENLIRLGKTFVDVAAVQFEVSADIGAVDRFELGEIGKAGFRYSHFLVHQSRVLLDRVLNLEYRRQLFVIYFDQLQRFLRRVNGQRRNGSHRITDVANLFDRNDRLIFEHWAIVGFDAECHRASAPP